ncbi:hypothetical protein R1sor_010343 [Riccia sorocarpa]|uniref:Uncharacterized protein n=1 Tax=Riccia sorocarpa TaxID=122646 RepID=A0ABD3I1F7_9MARC
MSHVAAPTRPMPRVFSDNNMWGITSLVNVELAVQSGKLVRNALIIFTTLQEEKELSSLSVAIGGDASADLYLKSWK